MKTPILLLHRGRKEEGQRLESSWYKKLKGSKASDFSLLGSSTAEYGHDERNLLCISFLSQNVTDPGCVSLRQMCNDYICHGQRRARTRAKMIARAIRLTYARPNKVTAVVYSEYIVRTPCVCRQPLSPQYKRGSL